MIVNGIASKLYQNKMSMKVLFLQFVTLANLEENKTEHENFPIAVSLHLEQKCFPKHNFIKLCLVLKMLTVVFKLNFYVDDI